MKVLLLTSSLEAGGAERQVVELANGLDGERFDVAVCSLSPEVPLASDLRDAARRLIILPKRRKYDIPLIWRAVGMMKRMRPDVVHSFLFDAEIVGRLAGQMAHVPAIICSNRCPHWARSRFKLWVARATTACFDRMIANSWAGYAFERDRQGIEESRLCVVPNGVDIEKFHPGDGAAKRRELGIPANAVVVGMFAHFRSNKDHLTLLESAALTLKNQPQVVFVLVGKPDAETPESLHGQARHLASQLGISQQVRFLGGRSDVAELYRAIDVKVLSTHFEGTPNVILEAMASGVPVVATDVSDNGRLIIDGETGFVAPPKDAEALAGRITRLASDPGLRRRMGQAARRRAETEYSPTALCTRTAAVYLDVLRRKAQG